MRCQSFSTDTATLLFLFNIKRRQISQMLNIDETQAAVLLCRNGTNVGFVYSSDISELHFYIANLKVKYFFTKSKDSDTSVK